MTSFICAVNWIIYRKCSTLTEDSKDFDTTFATFVHWQTFVFTALYLSHTHFHTFTKIGLWTTWGSTSYPRTPEIKPLTFQVVDLPPEPQVLYNCFVSPKHLQITAVLSKTLEPPLISFYFAFKKGDLNCSLEQDSWNSYDLNCIIGRNWMDGWMYLG